MCKYNHSVRICPKDRIQDRTMSVNQFLRTAFPFFRSENPNSRAPHDHRSIRRHARAIADFAEAEGLLFISCCLEFKSIGAITKMNRRGPALSPSLPEVAVDFSDVECPYFFQFSSKPEDFKPPVLLLLYTGADNCGCIFQYCCCCTIFGLLNGTHNYGRIIFMCSCAVFSFNFLPMRSSES